MNPVLILPLFISFFVTFLVLPEWIKRARRFGLVGKDMNKSGNREIAESGGIVVIAGFILGIFFYIALKTFYFHSNETTTQIFALTTSILMLTGLGMVDDLLGWKRGLNKKIKVLAIFISAVPFMVINAGISKITIPFLGGVNLGLLYPLVIIPVGIVGAASTFNFLAGYNGEEAGQGILLCFALSVVAFFTGNSWLSLIGLCMVFCLLAFWVFNRYPAKVFPGDALTYPLGGLIAIMAILGNFERIAVFFFIPYIAEFFLKARGNFKPQSFGKPGKDGSIELAYKKFYSLNHLAIWLLKKIKKKVYEKDVVRLVNLIQAIIIILGFIIFKDYIFKC